jgi:hypothetical protein
MAIGSEKLIRFWEWESETVIGGVHAEGKVSGKSHWRL